jgi:uncharacterized membrane protein
MQILYNTLMAVCAGLGLVLTANVLRHWKNDSLQNHARDHGIALIAVGFPLALLSFLMATTWPLHVNPPVNIAFAEPSALFGILLLLAGIVLIFARSCTWPTPVMIVVFVVGMILATISSAIFSYNLIGDAPPMEPITGQVTGWENTVFGVVYALAALGCLVAPWANRLRAYYVTYLSWTLAGVFFILFGVLNYRTHIGMLLNVNRGTDFHW